MGEKERMREEKWREGSRICFWRWA